MRSGRPSTRDGMRGWRSPCDSSHRFADSSLIVRLIEAAGNGHTRTRTRRPGIEKTTAARRAGSLAILAPRLSTGVSGSPCVGWRGVLPFRAVLRNRWTVAVGGQAPRGGGMAADRLPHEFEGAARDRPGAAPASRGNVPADRFSGDVVAVPQELLRL